MSIIPLLAEVFLESLAVLEYRILVGPILVAVLEDLTNVGEELGRGRVLVSFHTTSDSHQVHWTLDDCEVVWHTSGDGIDRVLEVSDESSPVARTGSHANDEITAVFKFLLGGQWNWLEGTTRSAVICSAAIWFGLSGLLLGGLDFERIVGTRERTNVCLAVALVGGTGRLEVVDLMGGRDGMRLVMSNRRTGRKITQCDNELTENLLRKGLGELVADLGRGAHFSSQPDL